MTAGVPEASPRPVPFVLASASPARLATLRGAGVDPFVLVSTVDEDAALAQATARYGDLTCPDIALLLARAKCEDVATRLEIGAARDGEPGASASHPGDTSASHPGDTSASHPGDTSASHPSDTSASHPSDDAQPVIATCGQPDPATHRDAQLDDHGEAEDASTTGPGAIRRHARGSCPAHDLRTAPARDLHEAPAHVLGADGALVLGCDSVLEIDGQVHGKPRDAQEARRRWRTMRGRCGKLHTGHWLIDVRPPDAGGTGATLGAVASTMVWFAPLHDDEIDAYIATGEPLNVAGAFTIDGLGGPFVDRIDGDPHNVVGVSLPVVRELLSQLGLAWYDVRRR